MRDATLRDLRDWWRRMRRSPGASFVVVASLGVAMAASATVFSFVNALMLRTLSVPDPQRLVAVESTDPKTTQPTGFYGDPFAVFQASQTSFAAVSLHSPGSYRVSARGVTSDVAADGVTSEYRNVLGMRMVTGRFVSGGERPVRPSDRRVRDVPADGTRGSVRAVAAGVAGGAVGSAAARVAASCRGHHRRDCRAALGLVKRRRVAPTPTGLRA